MLYILLRNHLQHEIQRDEHLLYIEEYGKADGVPILFLHEDQEVVVQTGIKNYLIIKFIE